MAVRRTPKVFNSNYRPPRPPIDWRPYLKLWPLVLLLIFAIGVDVLFHLPIFNIQTVNFVGSPDNFTTSTLDNLKGQSIFSKSINNTASRLRQSDLLISGLSCSRGIPNVLKCTVSLRQIVVTWESGSNFYAVDQSGFVFQKLSSAPSGMLIIEDRSGSSVKLGEEAISSDLIGKYQDIASSLTAAGFTVSNLYISDTLYQVGAVTTGNKTLSWQPAQPINLLFVTTSPIAGQISTIVTVVQTKASQVTQSIDVRVPGYVYIK
jgi:hypothetical protein